MVPGMAALISAGHIDRIRSMGVEAVRAGVGDARVTPATVAGH